MATVNIANWDAQSATDFDAAIDLANQYWRNVGEDKALRIVPGPPPALFFRYDGQDYEVHLEIGGLLFAAANIFGTQAAVTFRCTIRWRPRDRATDPAITWDSRNALFLWPNGARRTVPQLCAIIVHELTHKQQEINSLLGWLSFGAGYILTLGIPYERDADRMENGALTFATAAVAATMTVAINGPATIAMGHSANYVAAASNAAGPIPGGSYTWDLRVGDSRSGITCLRWGHHDADVRAERDEGFATLGVTFNLGGASATQSVGIRLAP